MPRLAVLLLFFCAAAWAQDAPPLSDDALRREAAELRERAKGMRQEAESRLETANRSCWERFLVTRCIEQAKLERQDGLAEARSIEQRARAIERDLRQREHEARVVRWADELPRQEVEAAQRAAKNRQAQEEAVRRVEGKQAEAERRQGRQ